MDRRCNIFAMAMLVTAPDWALDEDEDWQTGSSRDTAGDREVDPSKPGLDPNLGRS